MAEDIEQVDRKRLRTVRARFRAISAARLARVREGLPDRQRPFLDLLPLLLHVNHPALPGYVSSQAPCGIAGYRPASETIALARRHWRSFEPRAADSAHIDALYLMGSSGTLGQSRASDLDVWICYPESLAAASLALLQRKASMLGAWARELGIEAHLFLMNGEKFRRGEREALTGEDCGSAQHYLLLDEFYRSSILIAGKEPGWWAVPPDEEPQHDLYLGRLTAQRHLRSTELVDFGGIDHVPGGEFVGAGIWQLYKAIESPHKSLLKLLLFEVYASEYPEVCCLSAGYKRTVYAGVSDIDELDPYLVAYRRIEAHLQEAGQKERLELVRRCLYLKAGVRLSQPAGPRPPWQRQLVQRLVEEWGWEAATIAQLDSRPRWGIGELAGERNALVKELVFSYRALADFARRIEGTNAIDARELSVLGRKLHAAYERRAGKIDNLNTAGVADVAESELSVCAHGIGHRSWGAWRGLIGAGSHPEGAPLRQSTCLLELLGWCVLNGVVDERTRLGSREARDGLRHAELEALLAEVRAMLPGAEAGVAADDGAFGSPARPVALLVVANVAADPLAA
ncbi:MAG: class I adenylate cyclase, partial [Gammaproteobacteria bacterium]